jgi:hypothetical protein
MGAFGEDELGSIVRFAEQGCDDMAKEKNFPSYIHTNSALLALQRAMKGIQLIEDNDLTASQFRACLPVILLELNSVAYYLSNLKNRATPTPMFLNN